MILFIEYIQNGKQHYISKDIRLDSNGTVKLKLHTDIPDRSLVIIDALNEPDIYSKMIIRQEKL
ncbi:MAG: hypothetical protein JRI52_01890 [Deltaproteobacteria bacterium]|nr:hypothetical protein [Deltaproteobacteria bacterium]